jgi:hypothetical protein
VTNRRSATHRTLVATCLALALGCGAPIEGADGGLGDAWTRPGVPGAVVLLAPSTEGPDVPIDLFTLRITDIRLVGDRGPEFDPHTSDAPGLVAVGQSGLEIAIGDVAPALYSAVVVSLANGPTEVGEAVLELRMTLEHGPTLDITTTMPLELTARCEHGAVVNTTDAVRIGVDFALAEAVAIVFTDPLPPADGDGVVHVNESSAPEATADFRAMLLARVHAECMPDGT